MSVSWCHLSGPCGALLWAFLLHLNLHGELARLLGQGWLLGQGQLHGLPALAVPDAHSDGCQQVAHGQQREVAKIHIKLQQKKGGRTALGVLPSSHTSQGLPPS